MERPINEDISQQLEQPKPKIYLPEVREFIVNDSFLKWGIEQLKEIDDDGNTLRHSQRITNLGYRLAKKLNFSEEKEYDFLEACLLHDIGKISTPASILMKPHDEFTDEDMEVVRKHPREGKEILEMQGRSPRVCNAVLLHHEFQKKSYPALGAEYREIEDIDVDNARLLAMLDVFDTVVFGRQNIEPVPEEMRKITWMKQFDQKGDEEIIDFFLSQYETINNLSKP